MIAMLRKSGTFLPLVALIALAGCGWFGSDSVDKKKMAAESEKSDNAATNEDLVIPATEQIGTPMAERVATLGFLNKRNGKTRDIVLKPGQSIRIGRTIVRLRACERTAPWELTPEQGAFVQLLVNERPPNRAGEDQWKRVFSGWLFRESPSLNVVEHPIYDVWVKSCAMSFPGEEDAPEAAEDPTTPRAASSNVTNNSSSAENDTSFAPDDAPAAPPTATPAAPKAAPPKAKPPAPPKAEPAPDPIGDLIDQVE